MLIFIGIIFLLIMFVCFSNNISTSIKKKYEDSPATLKPPPVPMYLTNSDFKNSPISPPKTLPQNKIYSNIETISRIDKNTTVFNEDLYVTASYSQNKEWFIATSPCGHERNHLTNGKYCIRHNNKFLSFSNLVNPQKGVIANNGTHAIADDLDRNKYSSTGIFYVFSELGEPLIKKQIRNANILYIDITPNSEYAFCQTCNGDIYFFDLKKKKQCRHIELAIKLHEYKIDEKNKRLITCFQGEEYRYHFQGTTYIDGNSYLEDALLLKKDYPPNNEKILKLLLNAKNNEVSSSKEILLFKFLGETYYLLNEDKKAIFYLELSYKMNPKCGVKKLLNQIKLNTENNQST